jgi:hypothetical protein
MALRYAHCCPALRYMVLRYARYALHGIYATQRRCCWCCVLAAVVSTWDDSGMLSEHLSVSPPGATSIVQLVQEHCINVVAVGAVCIEV